MIHETGALKRCIPGGRKNDGAVVTHETNHETSGRAGATVVNNAAVQGGFMIRLFKTVPIVLLVPVLLLGAGCSSSSDDGGGKTEQPVLGIRTDTTGKAIITVDGLKFKDLNANGVLDPYEDWRLSALERAQDLVTRMSVAQKVGLMSESSYLTVTNDGSINTASRNHIVNYHLRQSLVRLASIPAGADGASRAKNLARYLNNVQELCEAQELGIPFVVTTDPSHGIDSSTNTTNHLSMWPMPLGLGAINDATLTRKFGTVVRKEFMALGLRWELGPMGDIASEPRWQRVQNTFGEVIDDVVKHTKACIQGFQAVGDGGLANGIAATMKHFPGAGPDQDGMDSHSTWGRYNVFPGNRWNDHLKPFIAAIEAGVAAVMPCYSIFKDNPWDYATHPFGSSYCPGIITDLLKNQLGFDGLVTSDWGVIGSKHWGLDTLAVVPTVQERVQLFLQAGCHQLGQDSYARVQEAYDQGLVTEEMIDEAATKILEMSFKLGIFENPYVDADATDSIVNSQENAIAGFEAQKKAIVILRNQEHSLASGGDKYLPISGSRKNSAGNYVCDTNGNGTVEVYYDGIVDELVNSNDALSAYKGGYDYTSPASGTSLAIVKADSLANADIAVIRITARPGVYNGLDAGIPLSFDGVFSGTSTDSTAATGRTARNKIIDALRVRDGYTDSTGTPVPAVNPTLKIVVVMYMTRPGIVEPFVKGLVTLDETFGVAGSYPLVSDPANTDSSGLKGIDGLLVDFGAIDRAVLDVVFNANKISGWTYGTAKLPMEIPSTDAAVDAQYEDVPSDSVNPTYAVKSGITY